MFDLQPAVQELTRIVGEIRDDQLDLPTPCRDTDVRTLLDHVDGLSQAFTWAATKSWPEGGTTAPTADGSRLTPAWRTRIPARLSEMARAWRSHDAWEGMTQAGGVDLTGEVAAAVALNEVVVHGWDLARSTGQAFSGDPDLLTAAHGFVQAVAAENPAGTPGLFGPPVPVPENAPLLDRIIGLSGRDPSWRPPAT